MFAIHISLLQLVQPSATVIILTVPDLMTVYVNIAMVRLKNNMGGMHLLGSTQEMIIENVVVSLHTYHTTGNYRILVKCLARQGFENVC